MIREEYPYKGRTDRIRHYSDAGKMVVQVETGNVYEEAVDVYPCRYTYIEGEDIPTEEVDDTEIAEALKEIL